MKRLFVLASVVFFALSSVAQNEDTDDYYFFDSDNVVGDLATYSEKTMDVAFEAPSTIITTPGVWYNFSYVTKNGKEMMRVDKAKMQFKAGGTGSMTKSGKIDVDYQNIKNIDIQLVVPISWQKTRDVLTIRTNTAQTSLKCTNQSQLNKLSAREKYDIDEKLKTLVNMATRSSGSPAASTKMLRLDKDIMITMSGNTKSGMVSQTGLDKLIKARTEYNKRQEEEKARLEEEKARQEAEIKARLEAEGVKKTYEVNGVKFAMVTVEGGTFMMGSDSGVSDEKPIHEVKLNSFSIGQTEVTQELWEAVMGSNPSVWKEAKHPVESVSWDDCQTFIQELNQLTGQQFRLPTEAEWEYAARGGKYSRGYKYSGSDNIEEVGWYMNNSRRQYTGPTIHEVATKAPNELGIYDMSGNVYEWCSDRYGSYSSGSQTNPTGAASGADRVRRGGSCECDYGPVGVASRGGCSPSRDSYLFIHTGLRLAQ